jgi:hypothetical protein
MRTVLIERGIVRVEAAGVHIVPPALATKATGARGPSKPASITSSEVEFFDHLATKRPDLVERLPSFLSEIGELGVTTAIGKTARLSLSQGPIVASIESNGKVWFSGAWPSANRIGHPDAAIRYMEAIAGIIGGQVRQYEKSTPEVLDTAGRGADVTALLARKDDWKRAMAAFGAELINEEMT